MMEHYKLIVSENYHRDIKNILHYITLYFSQPWFTIHSIRTS